MLMTFIFNVSFFATEKEDKQLIKKNTNNIEQRSYKDIHYIFVVL